MSSPSPISLSNLSQPQGGKRSASLSRSSHTATGQSQYSISSTVSHPSSKSSDDITEEELDTKPWKYIGYDGYSSFLASDNDFCNFRRFDKLNIRVILALQDKITCLEEELEGIDRLYSRRETADENNGSFRYDTRQERMECLWKIKDALENYNRFVAQYIKVKLRGTAADRDINSLKNWRHNHQGAIAIDEQTYIDKDDLSPLIQKERSPLRRLLEKSSRFRLSALWKQKLPTSELPVHCQDMLELYSDKRIDTFVTFTTVVIGLVMLIAPIWILAYTYPLAAKLGIITAFILVFLALLSFGTNAKPFESLAATAAYSAILMVFLQLGGRQ